MLDASGVDCSFNKLPVFSCMFLCDFDIHVSFPGKAAMWLRLFWVLTLACERIDLDTKKLGC